MQTLTYQSTQAHETALNFLNKPCSSGPLLVPSWESQMWLLVLELPFTNSETLGKPLYTDDLVSWPKNLLGFFMKCYGKLWMNFLANQIFFSSVKWGSWVTPGSLPCLPCTEQPLNESAPAVACILARSWLLPIAATRLWAPWSRDYLVHHQISLSPWPHTQQINKKEPVTTTLYLW